MLSQSDLKRLRSLAQKKYREEHNRFLVQGKKVVRELLLAKGWQVECVLASAEAAAELDAGAVPVHVLPQLELDRIGTFEKGNALIAIAHTQKPPQLRVTGHSELILALDGVRDPRNMGSLVRIADWYGIARIICSEDCVEPWNPKAVSSTMGSLFRTEIHIVADLAQELTRAHAAGAALYMADMNGAAAYDVALARPAILVLGSESHGLSAAVRAVGAQLISIPRIGHAESLNVAMAAAALCLEFTRQSGGRVGP